MVATSLLYIGIEMENQIIKNEIVFYFIKIILQDIFCFAFTSLIYGNQQTLG